MDTTKDRVTWKTVMESLINEIQNSDFQLIEEMQATRLVPLFYAPFLYCGTPGDAMLLPSGKKLGKCFEKWATQILEAVYDGELCARDPDSWLPVKNEHLTPACLVSWQELDNWSLYHFGLSSGFTDHFDELEIEMTDERSETEKTAENTVSNDDVTDRSARALYRIIHALALALSSLKPEVLQKDGNPWPGYTKDKEAGIAGYLVGNQYTTMSGGTISKHITDALKYDL